MNHPPGLCLWLVAHAVTPRDSCVFGRRGVRLSRPPSYGHMGRTCVSSRSIRVPSATVTINEVDIVSTAHGGTGGRANPGSHTSGC